MIFSNELRTQMFIKITSERQGLVKEHEAVSALRDFLLFFVWLFFAVNDLLEIVIPDLTKNLIITNGNCHGKKKHFETKRNETKRNRILTDQLRKNIFILKWKIKNKNIVNKWMYLCVHSVQFESSILFCRWIKLCIETQKK